MGAGRYAPSPTGDLHIGNLRTALLSWIWARQTGRSFFLRFEDLDRERSADPAHRASQLRDLEAVGVQWDGPVVVQSERTELYEHALETLAGKGLTFDCFCSRKDIRAAVAAAHVPPEGYPGTCLNLGQREAQANREALATRGAKPAKRLRPRTQSPWEVWDGIHGQFSAPVDQVVLRRGDGAFAYNLAVVVDDLAMGVDQVVRGADLLGSAPIHEYLAHELLGGPPSPHFLFAHVPLVLGAGGRRLAKRDGPVTLEELAAKGVSAADVVEQIGLSLGVVGARSGSDLLEMFDHKTWVSTPAAKEPWQYI